MINYQIIIPAFNASKTLESLLSDIKLLDNKPVDILVVDDGSYDNTASIAQQMGTKILKFEANMGKGYALKQGWQYLSEDLNSEYILFMDADLQHPASAIPKFIELAENKKSKFIIGQRDRTIKKMPIHRIISNKITSAIISFFSGQRIKDSQCGFRLVHKDVLRQIKLYENGFQLESEMILRAAEIPVKIDFIEIPTVYKDEKSYVANFLDTFKFIKLITKEMKKRITCTLRDKDQD
jgi:glycosyltransferase involved in cell wall biosynthesis